MIFPPHLRSWRTFGSRFESFVVNFFSVNYHGKISPFCDIFKAVEHLNKALIILILFFSCAQIPQTADKAEEVRGNEGTSPRTEDPPHESYLTIIAAGDNLFHHVMIRDGEDGEYELIYQEILSLVEPADIAFINQETLLRGEDFGFSGYPRFNSPQNLGRAITAAGFDVINHANNHVMDKGEKAILATLDFWDTLPQKSILGIHRSEEKRKLPVLIEKNNFTIGFLAYSYGTNWIPIPSDKKYMVSLADTEIMEKEIDALRPLCDFLVVSMHWGEEYSHSYSKEQEELADFLAEHQVDLVLGHHPHVLQPVEYIMRPDGRFMLCYYSLGNLISAQTQNPTLLGALAYIRIKKITYSGEGKDSFILFMDAGAIPVVSHYETGFTSFMIYPLYSYTEELLEKHWVNRVKKELSLNYFTDLAEKILGGKKINRNPFE